MEDSHGDTARGSAEFLFRDAMARLEWDAVLASLAGEACFDSTRAELLALVPDHESEERAWWLNATEEMLEVVASGAGPTLSPVDFSAFEGPLRRHAVLPAASLLQVLRLCELTESMTAFRKGLVVGAQVEPRLKLIHALLFDLTPQTRLRGDLARSIDNEGRILSSASPELRSARARAENARRRILSIVESMMQRSHVRDALQDPMWVERDGHIVLPVRVDRRGDVPGIARGMSNTGMTVFIEPQEISAARSELELAEADVQIEENRVLRALSDLAFAHREELEAAIAILSQFDALQARARFASLIQGVRPRFLPASGQGLRFSFLQARHPLFPIEGRECVPNDLVLAPAFDGDDDKFVWVLTGPNAGGKTVAMRTVGLSVLMAKAGLFVAADKAELVDFSHVFVELGDRQSREEDLSTFSGHLLHVKKILTNADERTLVLLDEGFVGTDPAVGMALARATLEFLASNRVTTIITTHFSNLKLVANENPAFMNACMEFESRRLAPTYRLINGIPGQSFALELASRIGYPQVIVENARSLYGDEAHRMELLLAELQEKRGELDLVLQEQTGLRRKMNEELERLKSSHALLAHQRETLVETFRTKLSRRLNAFENRLAVRERQFEKARLGQLQSGAASGASPAPEGEGEASAPKPAAPLSAKSAREAQKADSAKGGDETRPSKLSSFAELGNIRIARGKATPEKQLNADLERKAQEFRPPKQMSTRSLLDEARDSLDVLTRSMDDIELDFKREMARLTKEAPVERKVDVAPLSPLPGSQPARPAAFWKAGQRVKTPRFSEAGEVLRPADAKGMVECKFGNLRAKIPHGELRTLEDVARQPARDSKGDMPKARPAKPVPQQRNRVNMDVEPTLQHRGNTVDVRGRTGDEALSQAHDFLDRAWSTGVERIIIVHGHGTGRVKQTIREWLETCSYRLSFRPGVHGEGGDGVTVVQFEEE